MTFKPFPQICSVELDCERGAVMAATLANGGLCPITGTNVCPICLSLFLLSLHNKPYTFVQVLSKETICHTLSLMHSCGMYDSAGEFSFAVSRLLACPFPPQLVLFMHSWLCSSRLVCLQSQAYQV